MTLKFGLPARSLIAILVLCTLAQPLLVRVTDFLDLGDHVSVSDLRAETGLAFVGRLSDPNLSEEVSPTHAALFLTERRRGTILSRMPGAFNESYALSWLKALLEARFPNSTYDVRIALGPGQAPHQDIREKGGGRYSIWNGYIYFSLPAGVAFNNVSRLDLVVSGARVARLDTITKTASIWLHRLALMAALLLLFAVTWKAAGRKFARSGFARNLAPGLAISVALVVLLAAIVELYTRFEGMFPKSEVVWASRFSEDVGFTFMPGASIKYTNGVEYWTNDKVNSLGFLDYEPVIPKPAGTYRVLVVGDSFVEAVQLPLRKKI